MRNGGGKVYLGVHITLKRGLHRNKVALERLRVEIDPQSIIRRTWDEVQAFKHLLCRNIAPRGFEINPQTLWLLLAGHIRQIIEESLLD